jgi:hypothetical protein
MAQRIQSGTVVANIVTTVTFATWYQSIEIVNRGTVDMWARVDGVDPTIAGDDCIFVAPQGFVGVLNPKHIPEPPTGTTTNTEIRMIAASNCNYTVSAGI